MSDHAEPNVPVWTLSTSDDPLSSAISMEDALTPGRLAELRSALASFSSSPLVTLEAYPLHKRRTRSPGLALDAASPLARELSRLVADHVQRVPAVSEVAESGEVLYRMVVPAKVAAQMGKGLVKSMPSKAAANGVYDNLVNAATNKTVAKATLVPVERAAAVAAKSGAAGTAAGTGVATAAAGTAVTVAAPLVLMGVAVGMSAYADQQRQHAIDRITTLLEQLTDNQLEQERSELDGCRDSIDKATALLLDRGKVGASLGLDSAVHAISKATERARRRAQRWEKILDELGENRAEVTELEAAFPGITSLGGEFRAHLELASLAIALKRRVVVLQGVEAGQGAPDNPFESFVQSLKRDQQSIDDLEARIENVLLRLSTLELRTPTRLVDKLMTRKQVEALLETSYRLRTLGEQVNGRTPAADIVIEVEKHQDGTLHVLPARAS